MSIQPIRVGGPSQHPEMSRKRRIPLPAKRRQGLGEGKLYRTFISVTRLVVFLIFYTKRKLNVNDDDDDDDDDEFQDIVHFSPKRDIYTGLLVTRQAVQTHIFTVMKCINVKF